MQVSEDEITFLTGGDDPYDDNVVMKKLFHPNLKLLVVTEGSEGCRYYTKAFNGRVPGIKDKPVDTTGAGDAFVSGLLKSLASDSKLFQLINVTDSGLHSQEDLGCISGIVKTQDSSSQNANNLVDDRQDL
ncbi:hypothetical protein ES288_D02G118600v1 [Gossypium darwinii]|uniref:Carbohydrate kinase PfkB domain-containing protein n=1 Tax=Gossypium darwinii TaxID=34276 RepID=A0A5D2DFE1_GOSDA|nr:hypothetical protein ES288_D02G118600v1 [Gossypium darwinii]